MKEYNLAILGATGAVGQEFINLLNERDFPFKNLKLLASARSAGKELTVRGKTYKVEEAKADSFNGVDVALFAGGSISKTFAPIAVKAGAVVIDNSSTYRMDPEVPLIVPEVNPQDITKHKGIIANPNCSTIIMVMALKPIYDLARIKRIIVSTYQAASGAGKDGLDELERQIKEAAAGKEMTAHIFPSASAAKHFPLALNLVPQIDVFLDNLYTKEEMKMVNETKKIFPIRKCVLRRQRSVFLCTAAIVNLSMWNLNMMWSFLISARHSVSSPVLSFKTIPPSRSIRCRFTPRASMMFMSAA